MVHRDDVVEAALQCAFDPRASGRTYRSSSNTSGTALHVTSGYAALTRPTGVSVVFERFHIVTDGTPYSTRQVYEFIPDGLGRKPPSWNLPVDLLRAAARAGDVVRGVRGRRLLFDSDLLEKLLGSACYYGEPICRELGFRPRHDLRGSMAEMLGTGTAGASGRDRPQD